MLHDLLTLPVFPIVDGTSDAVARLRPQLVRGRIKKALRYLRQWGVPVDVRREPSTSEATDVRHHPGNATCRIDWKQRKILWTGFSLPLETGNFLIHELAHCLAPVHPDKINEATSLMLAFEYYSHRWLRLTGWREWQQGRGMNIRVAWRLITKPRGSARSCGTLFVPWNDAPMYKRHEALAFSLKAAVRAGVLTPEGRPTFQRPKWMPA